MLPLGHYPFFDNLPSDALLTIINFLSRDPSFIRFKCPLFALSRVSYHARTLIASTVGKNVSFSVSGSATWFRFWLALSTPYLKNLCLHQNFLDSPENYCQISTKWPYEPTSKLDTCSLLTAVLRASPPLVELDVSGLRPLRRIAVQILGELLLQVRTSLRTLRLDLGHNHVSSVVANAKLHNLNKLAVINLHAGCEDALFEVMRSLRPLDEVACPIKELALVALDSVPTMFRDKRDEIGVLLRNLETFELDYDDEFNDCVPFSDEELNNLSFVTLPCLRRICLSGSGIPVTRKLVEDIRRSCEHLTDLQLVDCDVDPSIRLDDPNIGSCNIALSRIGGVLTKYHPRWVTFEVEQLTTLAFYCTNLTHLRVFSAPGTEESLLRLGNALRTSLVDLEVYPQRHETRRELAGPVVRMVQTLEKLERICVVTMDLSTTQLKAVLGHCGRRLKSFVFSPPVFARKDGDSVGASVAEVMLFAAVYNPNLRRIDCIFRDDRVPIIKSVEVADKLKVAVRVLESRAKHLELSNVVELAHKMTAKAGQTRRGKKGISNRKA